MKIEDKTALLTKLLTQRILVLDGAMGTMIQARKLGEADYRGAALCGLAGHACDVKGDNDLLALTQPDVVRAIHDAFLAAGADIIETMRHVSRRPTIDSKLVCVRSTSRRPGSRASAPTPGR